MEGFEVNQEQRLTLAARLVEAQRIRYARTGEEGDFEDAARHYRDDSSEQELLSDWCAEVGYTVRNDYGHDDGCDLCHSLIEIGVIDYPADTINQAAQTVAQHMEQQ